MPICRDRNRNYGFCDFWPEWDQTELYWFLAFITQNCRQ